MERTWEHYEKLCWVHRELLTTVWPTYKPMSKWWQEIGARIQNPQITRSQQRPMEIKSSNAMRLPFHYCPELDLFPPFDSGRDVLMPLPNDNKVIRKDRYNDWWCPRTQALSVQGKGYSAHSKAIVEANLDGYFYSSYTYTLCIDNPVYYDPHTCSVIKFEISEVSADVISGIRLTIIGPEKLRRFGLDIGGIEYYPSVEIGNVYYYDLNCPIILARNRPYHKQAIVCWLEGYQYYTFENCKIKLEFTCHLFSQKVFTQITNLKHVVVIRDGQCDIKPSAIYNHFMNGYYASSSLPYIEWTKDYYLPLS